MDLRLTPAAERRERKTQEEAESERCGKPCARPGHVWESTRANLHPPSSYGLDTNPHAPPHPDRKRNHVAPIELPPISRTSITTRERAPSPTPNLSPFTF